MRTKRVRTKKTRRLVLAMRNWGFYLDQMFA
jgi:hypothetical protein